MMRQAAWLTVLLVMVCSLPVAATEAVVKQPTVGLASDQSRSSVSSKFLPPAGILEPMPENAMPEEDSDE